MAQSRTSPCAAVCADVITAGKLREAFNVLMDNNFKQRKYLFEAAGAIERLNPDFKFDEDDYDE